MSDIKKSEWGRQGETKRERRKKGSKGTEEGMGNGEERRMTRNVKEGKIRRDNGKEANDKTRGNG